MVFLEGSSLVFILMYATFLSRFLYDSFPLCFLPSAELEFVQVIIIIVVITVMVVVIICLLNHYKISFINRQSQSGRQEESLQPVSLSSFTYFIVLMRVALLRHSINLQLFMGKHFIAESGPFHITVRLLWKLLKICMMLWCIKASAHGKRVFWPKPGKKYYFSQLRKSYNG